MEETAFGSLRALTQDARYSIAKDACRGEGMIKNFNTIEDFKRADRPTMLKRAAKTVLFSIQHDRCLGVDTLEPS